MEIGSLKKLERNPLFQMSLGSKELFHSNFLAWIISKQEQVSFVLNFLNDLLQLANKIKAIIEFPEREKMNIDLRFKVELNNNTQRLIIIENKVKSLPYKEQLLKYYTETEIEREKKSKKKNGEVYEVNYYLLSLVSPDDSILLNNKNEKIWTRISYENIADSMNKNLAKLQQDSSDLIPFESIIKSYSEFACLLQDIAENDLKIKDEKNEHFDYFNSETRKKYQSLRLHDLYLKSKYQQIAIAIKKRLIENYKDANIDFNFNPWEKLRKKSKTLTQVNNGVFIKEGFSNSNGMIDFKFIPKKFTIENTNFYYAFCLQLQGDQLRYALEFMGNFEGEKKQKATKLIYEVARKLSNSQKWLELPKDMKTNRTVFVNTKILGKPKKASEYDKERKFCKFDNLFLYKYHKISSSTNVISIIDLYEKIFAYLYENKESFIKVLDECIKNDEVLN